VTRAVPPARPNAWQRLAWWDAYCSVTALAVAVFVIFGESSRTLAARVASVALIGCFLVWYAALGRRLIGRESGDAAAWVFTVGACVLTATATAFASAASFLLFALVPIVFTIMPLVPATVVVVVLNLLPSVVYLARTGDLAGTVRGPLPVAALVTVFAVAFAIWVDRIVRQSDERATLIESLTASRAEVARLSHEAGVAAERQRLAGEIHDTIAQGLSSVVMLVQAAETDLDRDPARTRRHLDLAGRMARENLAEARALVAGVPAAPLAGASLADVLRRLTDRFHDETGIPVSTDVVPLDEPLPTALEVVLLRAAQEALANVRKHANAGAVRLQLARRAGSVVLTVVDDGCGIAAPAAGFGLTAMRARVADVGGALRVDAPPAGGTRLEVRVPADVARTDERRERSDWSEEGR
jgi:signal transduction histidine kinase